MIFRILVVAVAMLFAAPPAQACLVAADYAVPTYIGTGCGKAQAGVPGFSVASQKPARAKAQSYERQYDGVGPRPARWCGWWMRTQFGGGPQYNLAWNWSKRGVASGPHVGAVVVWRHHVGIIVGRAANGAWLVKSGNDGGAVRTRARSVKGAVFRALV